MSWLARSVHWSTAHAEPHRDVMERWKTCFPDQTESNSFIMFYMFFNMVGWICFFACPLTTRLQAWAERAWGHSDRTGPKCSRDKFESSHILNSSVECKWCKCYYYYVHRIHLTHGRITRSFYDYTLPSFAASARYLFSLHRRRFHTFPHHLNNLNTVQDVESWVINGQTELWTASLAQS